MRRQTRDEKGKMSGNEYIIYEQPQNTPPLDYPSSENPTTDKPTTENPLSENPTQLNKDIQNTEKINTDLSSTHSIPIHSPNPLPYGEYGNAEPERNGTEAARMNAVNVYEDIIKENIEYDIIADRYNRESLDEIVGLILETVCTARKTIRVAGDDYPAELVKSKFLKLNSSHIEFVLDCLKQNTTKVRNIKKYMLAVLFNAPTTIDSYYTALVAHDMAHWDGEK